MAHVMTQDELYRITCEGYIHNPMLLNRDGILYFVGFRTSSPNGVRGDLVYRFVADTDSIYQIPDGDFVPNFHNYYKNPFLYNIEAPRFGIIAEDITNPWYVISGGIVFFAYDNGGYIVVGRYTFDGDILSEIVVEIEGSNPVLALNSATGAIILFYRIGNELRFKLTGDGIEWSQGFMLANVSHDTLDAEWVNSQVGIVYDETVQVYFDLFDLIVEPRYKFISPPVQKRFSTRRNS